MSFSTQPISVEADAQTDMPGARERLDALSKGTCDQAAFLRSVNEALRTAPDDGWEILSLVDQYYRRGKLTPDVFRSLNSHLQALLMGNSRTAAANPPDPTTEIRTAPPLIPAPPVAAAATPQQIPGPLPMPAPPASLRGAPEFVKITPSAVAAGAAPAVGEMLRSRYRILGVLGQGAMGTVFEAIDQYRMEVPGDSQKVALKVLHAAVAQRPELLAELRREFQHLQSLSHPNIVRVHEFDRDGNTAFFTMECLAGLLLSRVLLVREDAPMSRPHALGIIRDVGAALAHAHGRGVVHGDLNPGNVFVTDTGNVRVLNFGASYQLHRSGTPVSEFDPVMRFPDTASTYASAQVLEGDPADARDDIYAFACIAYVLLTGRHPFQQYTAIKARSLRLVPERPDGFGRRQWQTLRAGLLFERDQRPADMLAWLEKLDLRADSIRLPALPALMTARNRTARGGIWVVTAALLALAAGGGWWVTQHVDALRPGVTSLREQAKPLLDTARSSLRDSWHKAGGAAAPVQPAPSVAQQAPHPVPKASATVDTPAAAAGNPTHRVPGYPSALPPSRIELGADTVESVATEPAARITVRRQGNLHGDATFTWWTESGTAKPGRDFSAVKPRIERLEDGKASMNLLVPIIAPASRPNDRSFYVVIDEPSSNAILGARTLTMVTIPASP